MRVFLVDSMAAEPKGKVLRSTKKVLKNIVDYVANYDNIHVNLYYENVGN